MLPVTICHFIKDYQHRKKIRCAAVTESQCLCLSDRTGRYALHTLFSILSHHMVPLRIIAICISEMSYISQTERIKCRVERERENFCVADVSGFINNDAVIVALIQDFLFERL